MADCQIRPAAEAPAVVSNSRDTRMLGSHPSENHVTNGKGVQMTAGPGQAVRSTMGAAGARVAATTAPAGTPKAQTGTIIQKPAAVQPVKAPATAATVKADAGNAFDKSEAALALDIVEGEVSRAITTNAVPASMVELAKSVVRKLRAQAGIPASIPLPWDLAPPQISSAPVPVPGNPQGLPVPDLSGSGSRSVPDSAPSESARVTPAQ